MSNMWTWRSKRTLLPQITCRDPYEVGDCYNWSSTSEEWKLDCRELPYLAKVKQLSRRFPTLRYLADWMEVSTMPLRWTDLRSKDSEREYRANKVHITLVESRPGTKPTTTLIRNVNELKAVLHSNIVSPATQPGTSNEQTLRLFLVEDLSRQMIELLGSRFDIDPLFFREHIETYVWDNVRDPWAKTPDLTASKKRRQWFSVGNGRPLYHVSKRVFQDARRQANQFNVFRRPDDDATHFKYLDASGAKVSFTRTRTTIWLGKDKKCEDAPVGIVLIDPTVKAGYPLWYNRANWLPVDTNMEFTSVSSAPKSLESWYNAIVEMTKSYPWFDTSVSANTLDSRIVMYPAIYTICAEWLLVCKYVHTRLSQAEWELTLDMPGVLSTRGETIDNTLKSLGTWRRQLPVWVDMVAEMLEDAFPAALRLLAQSTPDEAAENILCDMKRILNSLRSLQARVERLENRGLTEMQLEAARQGLTESHNLARLTWLATIFIPLSFVSGLFSMTDDVNSIRNTFKTYFKVAIPLAVGSLLVARWGSTILRLPQRMMKRIINKQE